MPKIRFPDLPHSLWRHLLDRVQAREITLGDLRRLQEWVRSEPFASDGDWYKDFGSFKICGNGSAPKTFLLRRQAANGKAL